MKLRNFISYLVSALILLDFGFPAISPAKRSVLKWIPNSISTIYLGELTFDGCDSFLRKRFSRNVFDFCKYITHPVDSIMEYFGVNNSNIRRLNNSFPKFMKLAYLSSRYRYWVSLSGLFILLGALLHPFFVVFSFLIIIWLKSLNEVEIEFILYILFILSLICSYCDYLNYDLSLSFRRKSFSGNSRKLRD